MNCPHCQNPVPVGAAFCSRCGNRVTLPQPAADPYAQQYQQQKASLRQSEMNVLGELIQYFSPKQSEFDAYDDTCKKLLYYARGAKNALLVWGCIAFSIGLLGTIISLSEHASTDDLIGFGILLMLPGVLMAVGGILMKVNNRSKYRRYAECYAQLSQSLYHHYLGYSNCPVGPEYANPRVLHVLLRILRSGRCDTIKEAINCMVADGNYAAIARYCQQIQQETASINANTRVLAVFAASRFFK